MLSAAQIAKATLRRLASTQQEPTPENYTRAWAQEAGTPAPAPAAPAAAAPGVGAAQWATLIERVVRGIERGGRNWTSGRKKDSLQRVLASSRSDANRLHDRLGQLVGTWETDTNDAGVETQTLADEGGAPLSRPAALDEAPAARADPGAAMAWRSAVASFESTVQTALPADDSRARELASELARLAKRLDGEPAGAALLADIEQRCREARRLLSQRHHLVEQLATLARELTAGIADLAEDQSWAQGQAQAMRARLGDGDGAVAMSVRSVRATQDMLAQTRRQQQRLKGERDHARDALKTLVQSLVAELGGLGGQTSSFTDQLGRYAQAIEQADSLDSLAGLVHEMMQHGRDVQAGVSSAAARLQAGQAEAEQLTTRVQELEGELRRLADEAQVDALTQVANRRGLTQAFETESARHARDGGALAVALIDIDNFKRLNDSLGHSVGDSALKALAARVRDALRPIDHVARFGGEEFVLLLPGTATDDAQQALTRLQRELSASLFMHQGRDVFVTFSAGVTAWRPGEALDAAIERADEALYEAKRTGKNRTCAA